MPHAIVMPTLGMYTEEGTLSAWVRPSGTRVEPGEAVAEITTDKVTIEIPAPVAGVLHHVASVGTNLAVEAVLGYILADGEAVPEISNSQPPSRSAARPLNPSVKTVARRDGVVPISPAARKLATEHGIDPRQVKGSGPGGRIIEADILARIEQEQT